jgi:peptidoglycan/xylan/chitin deacetylase (PgdA/CDA1 family)
MYHQVGYFPRPSAHRSTYCHIRRFRLQMRYLKMAGIPVLSLQQAHAILFEGQPFRGHGVVLTFDDGCIDFRDNVWPLLRDHGFPAAVFVVSGLIGKTAEWFARDGRDAPMIMDAQTITELSRQGVTFGPHTLTHPRLSELDDGAIAHEVRESKLRMDAILDRPTAFFCYPYGDYDDRVRAVVRQAGFRAALSCIRGSAYPGREDPYQVPRKAISHGDTLAGFWWKLHMKNRRKQPVAGY